MFNLHESPLSINGVGGIVTSVGDSDDAEAVICLHGMPGSGRDFQWLLPETAKIVRSIAIDLPGFGKADKPGEFPYSVEGYQTWLSPALDELGVERAHLVLHDFGGPIGLMWAAMNPHKVASVVLIDTGVLTDYRWHLLGRLWRTRRIGEAVQAGTTRPLFKLWMRRGNIRGLDSQWLDELIDEDERQTRSATLKLYRNTDEPGSPMLGQALAPHRKPALVIWGRRDPYTSWRYAERQRETFPEAAVHVWDDCGHWPHVQHPGRTADTVTAFLRTVVDSER
jgi:pimeloyl-ACP methyl ester carboxylesterase